MHEPYQEKSQQIFLVYVVTIIWSTKAFSIVLPYPLKKKTVLPYNNNDNKY